MKISDTIHSALIKFSLIFFFVSSAEESSRYKYSNLNFHASLTNLQGYNRSNNTTIPQQIHIVYIMTCNVPTLENYLSIPQPQKLFELKRVASLRLLRVRWGYGWGRLTHYDSVRIHEIRVFSHISFYRIRYLQVPVLQRLTAESACNHSKISDLSTGRNKSLYECSARSGR